MGIVPIFFLVAKVQDKKNKILLTKEILF